jgi:hypothetical protein
MGMTKRVSALQVDVSSDSEGPYDPYRPYKNFVPSPKPSPARPPSPDMLMLDSNENLELSIVDDALDNKEILREKKEVLALFPQLIRRMSLTLVIVAPFKETRPHSRLPQPSDTSERARTTPSAEAASGPALSTPLGPVPFYALINVV